MRNGQEKSIFSASGGAARAPVEYQEVDAGPTRRPAPDGAELITQTSRVPVEFVRDPVNRPRTRGR
jgi:hypothetical protein